jgi:hypothetical protein
MVKQMDDCIYLFAAVNQPAPGLKVARVLEADIADRSKVSQTAVILILKAKL